METYTLIAVLLILLAGIPHGSLDLQLLEQRYGEDRLTRNRLFFSYLAIAGIMAAIWHSAPSIALAVFFVAAILHFSEDWAGQHDRFFDVAIATALLSAPAIMHDDRFRQLVVTISATENTILVDILAMIAPVSIAIAILGLVILYREGSVNRSMAGAAALASMVFLSPLIAFAVFFVIIHTPRHIAESWRAAIDKRKAKIHLIFFTGLAYGIAASVALLLANRGWSSATLSSTFITLSILTIPHLMMPKLATVMLNYRPHKFSMRLRTSVIRTPMFSEKPR